MEPPLLHALERAVQEFDAIQAIYGGCDGSAENEDSVVIHSEVELLRARSALETLSTVDGNWTIPQHLDIEIKLNLNVNNSNGIDECIPASLRCKLPAGYPHLPAAVTVSITGLHRSTLAHQHLYDMLNKQALEAAESETEALMDLIQTVEEHGSALLHESRRESYVEPTPPSPSPSSIRGFGRRWIWAHHILDGGRRKSIVAEACALGLGGYLKSGYPGVVVVEGRREACEEYVQWIKGNKSRPGGFGRNWGHHVRGEVNCSMLSSDDHDYDHDHDHGDDTCRTSISANSTLNSTRPRQKGGSENQYCHNSNDQVIKVNIAEKEKRVKIEEDIFIRKHRQLPEMFSEVEELSTLGQTCKAAGLESEFLEYIMQHNHA